VKHNVMSFLRSLALAVGMALATSCLAMIARLGGTAGAWLLPALTSSLVIALAVAHAIGRLAQRFPSALGVRTYLKAAFGNTTSLFFVFLYLFMITLVAGVESQLYAAIVQQVLPGVPPAATVVAVFAAVLAFNAAGQEFSRHVQLALVLFMVGGLLALSGHAIFAAAPGALAHVADERPVSALPLATIGAFFLYVGFEWVTSSQPGSRQAAAQLPRVLLAAVAVLGVVYLAFAAAVLMQLGPAALAHTRAPQLLLAALLWGESGRWLLLAVSTAAVLMAFNAGVLGAARLVYALAREGVLPAPLARTAARSGAPVPAVLAIVALALGCSGAVRAFDAGDAFANTAAVIICLCYAALLAASLVLARRQPRPAPRWAFGVEATALGAMLLLLVAMLADPAAWLPSSLAATACALLLLCARRAHARTHELSQSAPRGLSRLHTHKEPA
jgi:amino acid transporter